jgi:two-component system sensor histidine kinase YesM
MIFLAVSTNYVKTNILENEKRSLISNSEITYNETLKKIETIDLISSYIEKDLYLVNFLKDAYTESLTLAQKQEFIDSNIAGLESIININNDVDYIRIYSNNVSVTELLPTLYSVDRIVGKELYNYQGWLINYKNNIFSKDDEDLVGYIYSVDNDYDQRVATIELALSIDNMFFSKQSNDVITAIYNNGFYSNSELTLDDIISFDQLEDNSTVVTEDYMINIKYFSQIDTYLINIQDLTTINNSIADITNLIIFASILIASLLSLLMNYIIKRLFTRFYKVVEGITTISDGNLDTVIDVSGNDEIHDLADEVNIMTSSFKEIMQRNINREVIEKESQIKAMQSQINSHFIYNTLESIKMMAEINEIYDISDALTDLGKLLRYSMKWSNGLVIVEDEINYIKSYLKLGDIRYDNKITLVTNLNGELLEQVIPKMTLQPIVENAVKYGADGNDLVIEINGYYDKDKCFIEIIDYGYGIKQETIDDLQKIIDDNDYETKTNGNGIALKNINKRIKVQFGEEYGILITSEYNEYTKIIIKLPSTRKI